MRSHLVHTIILAMSLAGNLSGCQGRPRSLVGDWAAPDLPVLSKETVLVSYNIASTKAATRSVQFTINPRGTVHFKQILQDGAPFHPQSFEIIEVRGRFALDKDEHQNLLKQLALLHPNEKSAEIFVGPIGCRHIMDGSFKAGVSFSVRSTVTGLFQLQDACRGANALAVERLYAEVFHLLRRAALRQK